MEQAKALDITTRMKNKERTGAEVLTIDKNSNQYANRFWQEIGGSESELSDQSEDDVAYEQAVDQVYKLYKLGLIYYINHFPEWMERRQFLLRPKS